jgi:hypothetical protein
VHRSSPCLPWVPFALLYLAEGAPIGFLWWALPTWLREQGLGVDRITGLTADNFDVPRGTEKMSRRIVGKKRMRAYAEHAEMRREGIGTRVQTGNR